MATDQYLRSIENCERNGLEFLLASWRETRVHIGKVARVSDSPRQMAFIVEARNNIEEIITGIEKLLTLTK